jgi:GTP-binding protein
MRTRFITSGADPNSFPASRLPEIAFAGRSNVGKSSLLNKVAGAKVARTSKTPGRTQLINFFEVSSGKSVFMLADLPGYGFAEAPKSVRRAWLELLEAYLAGRDPLVAVLMLIDVRRGIQEEDAEIFRWLTEVGGPERQVFVVGTKGDKLAKAQQKPALRRMAESLSLEVSQVQLTSATSGQGIEPLRSMLRGLARLRGSGGPGVGQTSVDALEPR